MCYFNLNDSLQKTNLDLDSMYTPHILIDRHTFLTPLPLFLFIPVWKSSTLNTLIKRKSNLKKKKKVSADQEHSVQIYFPREIYASDRIQGLSFVCDKMPIWFFFCWSRRHELKVIYHPME